ncbi:uncharacterized protein N7503_000849 [Penicillium pulvis]|uniref:uncharacterized protein n=1 Tax=Penicillium pulvis TaxID=1562058 RepID=UPI0025467BD8|nr:uncharacterized protein N7503_000849 [Penicillium pulvis]KAJ5814099.1 hypothetical protein N7503_000849 [Penicillium pulvis]
MNEDISEASLMCHQPRKLRLLYEPLCLLYTLSQVRGDRIKPSEILQEEPGLTDPKRCRDFVDAIAYICAYRKEPGYVTAVALEETPEEIVILLAANSGIDSKVTSLLETIQRILSWVISNHTVRLDEKEGQQIFKFLADCVLSLNAPKIFQYYQQVNKTVSLVMDRLCTESTLKGTRPYFSSFRENPALLRIKANVQLRADRDSIIKLRTWFAANLSKDGIPLQESDMPTLALSSYRDQDVFKALYDHPGNAEQSRHFERLSKLLYKLGKHVSQCKRLILATMGLRSQLARGLRIETINRSPEKRITLSARTCNIKMISNRMFSLPAEREQFLRQLQQIYSEDELDRVLSRDLCKSKTRVHAELLVLDHFEQTRGRFLFEQDRYIGCSKPACYLCHLFITCHPGKYAIPPSHQKLYTAWRLPDIHASGSNAAIRYRDQKDILSRMTDTVRRNLTNDIATSAGRRMNHADSTAGGTSTIIDIESDLISSTANLSIEEFIETLDLQYKAGPNPRASVVDTVFPPLSNSSSPSEDSAEAESDDESPIGGVKL